MTTLANIARVWRSAGRGVLSAVVVLLLIGLTGCEKRDALSFSEETDVSFSERQRQLSAFIFPLYELLPPVSHVCYSEVEGLSIVAGQEKEMDKNGEEERKVKVYCFSRKECCGAGAIPCDPVFVADCGWGPKTKDCVTNATKECFDKGGVCVHIVQERGRPRSDSPDWTEGWQALERLPLRENEGVEVKLRRLSDGTWIVEELHIKPYPPEVLIPAHSYVISSEPFSFLSWDKAVAEGIGEAIGAVIEGKEMATKKPLVWEESYTREEIVRLMQTKVPGEVSELYLWYRRPVRGR